jgi:hypothetical protein
MAAYDYKNDPEAFAPPKRSNPWSAPIWFCMGWAGLAWAQTVPAWAFFPTNIALILITKWAVDKLER